MRAIILILSLVTFTQLNAISSNPKIKIKRKKTDKNSIEYADYTIPGKLVGSNPSGVALCKGKTGVCMVIIELPANFYRISLNTEEGWVHYGANEVITEEDGELTIVKFR